LSERKEFVDFEGFVDGNFVVFDDGNVEWRELCNKEIRTGFLFLYPLLPSTPFDSLGPLPPEDTLWKCLLLRYYE
jgi:hypothetical protein